MRIFMNPQSLNSKNIQPQQNVTQSSPPPIEEKKTSLDQTAEDVGKVKHEVFPSDVTKSQIKTVESSKLLPTAQKEEQQTIFGGISKNFITQISKFIELCKNFFFGKTDESERDSFEMKTGEYFSLRGYQAISMILEEDLEKLSETASKYDTALKYKFVNSRLDQIDHLKNLTQGISSEEGGDILRDKLKFLEEKYKKLQQTLYPTISKQKSVGRDETKKEIFASNLTQLADIKKEPPHFVEKHGEPFTPKEKETLKNLSRLYATKTGDVRPILDDSQKKELAGLFIKALGNFSVNKQMEDFIEARSPEIDINIAELLKDFAFKTRDIEGIQHLIAKAENLMGKIQKSESIGDDEKLSLEELGKLDAFSKIGNVIEIIKELELNKSDERLIQMIIEHEKASRILLNIQNDLNQESTYKAGDFLLQDHDKLLRFDDLENNWVPDSFIIPLEEAAVCCKDEVKGDQVSSPGIGEYKREDFNLRNRSIMSAYRLDPSKFLDDLDFDLQGLLEDMFLSEGKETSSEIQKMYQDIQNDMHSNLQSVFTDKKIPPSKFEAQTMVAGLNKLEETLREKLLNHLVNKLGWKESDERYPQFSEKQIFVFPLPENQLANMNTTHLIKFLEDRKYITRIDPPPLLQNLIKAEDLKTNL